MNKILILVLAAFFSLQVFSQDKSTMTDPRDNKTYKTVKLGNSVWMAENLNYETKDSWCYQDNFKNCDTYGRLYSREAAISACPRGWRLANDNDWETLINTYGSKTDIGGFLKATGTTMWKAPNTNAIDKGGFTALPAGYKKTDGTYTGEGTQASFWSVFNDNKGVWGRHLTHDSDKLNSFNSPEINAMSVRCVKD